VVIATLHREACLCETIRQMLDSQDTPAAEVIVIDQSDRHDEATRAFLAAPRPRFAHVQVDYKSVTRARNHGVRLSTGDIVLFVDDDVEPVAPLIAAHLSAYGDATVIGVAGCVLTPGQSMVAASTLAPGERQALLEQRDMRFDVDMPFAAQWARGCNMSFRREVFDAAGGFDEGFIGAAIGEEAEFCHRARRLGTIRFVPDARLTPLTASTGGTRDAPALGEYVAQVAYCTHYFWHRVGASPIRRWRSLLIVFRQRVITRASLRSGSVLRLAWAFARGLRQSAAALRIRPAAGAR
jgi:GT2 family glycosyltransferase